MNIFIHYLTFSGIRKVSCKSIFNVLLLFVFRQIMVCGQWPGAKHHSRVRIWVRLNWWACSVPNAACTTAEHAQGDWEVCKSSRNHISKHRTCWLSLLMLRRAHFGSKTGIELPSDLCWVFWDWVVLPWLLPWGSPFRKGSFWPSATCFGWHSQHLWRLPAGVCKTRVRHLPTCEQQSMLHSSSALAHSSISHVRLALEHSAAFPGFASEKKR